MENPPFLIGKPSISMGHLYHGYVSDNQRVIKINPLSSSGYNWYNPHKFINVHIWDNPRDKANINQQYWE